MRIVGGVWRGRRLVAPAGNRTRPTADRVRQALFDMLFHASWGGPDAVAGVRVVDAFAGTGALGLEAISRGAACVTFFETDPAALAALRANVAALGVGGQTRSLPTDPRECPVGEPARLLFFDPPYGRELVPRAFWALAGRHWVGQNALVVAEIGRQEQIPVLGEQLAERVHGAARLVVWRTHRAVWRIEGEVDQAASAASSPAQK